MPEETAKMMYSIVLVYCLALPLIYDYYQRFEASLYRQVFHFSYLYFSGHEVGLCLCVKDLGGCALLKEASKHARYS